MKQAALIALVVISIAGCANDRAYREGQRLLAEGKNEEGIKSLEQAVIEEPGNAQYRTALLRSREDYLKKHLVAGDAALNTGRLDEAESQFKSVLRMHPENTQATAGLAAIETRKRNVKLLSESEEAIKKEEFELARVKLRTVLAQQPDHAEALQLMKLLDEKSGRTRGVEFPQLATSLRRSVTLEFRDAPLKSVMDAIARQGGFNIVFDKDVRLDQRTTVFAKDTVLVDAMDMLLATNQLDRKVLNQNTMLIYPNVPAKRKDYEDVVVKSFFLANTDAKSTVNMIKTMAKIRDVYMDEGLNMVMVRDTPEAVRLAEKLIKVADRPEPEVMLEVEIMEVKRNRLLELGAQWPTQLSLLSLRDIDTVTTSNGVTVATTTTQTAQQLTLDSLKNIDSSKVGVSPNPTLNFRGEDSDVNLLANPRIRVKNKEKARIHIGDKVPVITSNTTSTGVVSESVSYLDVGLKLDVEPQVHLEGDVAIKVGLEVSNIVREIKSGTGTLTYQLGSRNANTVLRLRNGETQVLAGLISDEDRSSANKFPGLGDLPLLGRLFSNNRDENNKTEIVLLITPRIIRNVERPELSDAEFFAGTENNISDQPLRLRPAAPSTTTGNDKEISSPTPATSRRGLFGGRGASQQESTPSQEVSDKQMSDNAAQAEQPAQQSER